MSITKENKQQVIKEHARTNEDTGSVEVQVAILTSRINSLTKHCQVNHKDFHSRRGLLMLVGRRRRLLAYLKKTALSRYLDLIGKLGLRK